MMRLPGRVVRKMENVPVQGFLVPSELGARWQHGYLSALYTGGHSAPSGSWGLSGEPWKGWSHRRGPGHSWSPTDRQPREPAFTKQAWGPLWVPVSPVNVGLTVAISQCPVRERVGPLLPRWRSMPSNAFNERVQGH